MNGNSGVTHSTSERVQFLFRLWSRVYDRPVFQRTYYGRVHKQLLASIETLAPGAVLDAGCGTGELLVTLARRWPQSRLVGLDLSPDMLELARGKDYGRANVDLVEGSVYSLPFENESFDLLTNTISSHFYTNLPQALSEFSRVARPGATLVMASLGNGPLRHFPGPWRDVLPWVDAEYRSPREQRRHMENAGFEVGHVERLPWPAWLYVGRKR